MQEDMDGGSDTLSSLSSIHTNVDNEEIDVEDDDDGDDVAEFAIAALLLEEEDYPRQQRGGSYPGKAPNKKRDFEGAADNLIRQYFSGDDSVYSENDFRRRFRMDRKVFEKIYSTIVGEGTFAWRYN